MNSSSTLRAILAGTTLVLGAQAATAQTGRYYLTDGDTQTSYAAQGGGVLFSFQQQNNGTGGGLGEYGIAVSNGTIRTIANGNCGVGTCANGLGSQYDLLGNYTGTNYAYPVATQCFYDGTTDGTYNYTADYCGGGVYRTGLDWSAPQLLFSTAASTLGITYDPTTNTLFTAQFFGGRIDRWSMTGTPLGSFATVGTENASLAMDYSDGTLWAVDGGTADQYSTSGTFLGTANYANVGNVLGGEFELAAIVTPEPGSIALIATGLVALVPLARRRRS